MEVAPPKKFTSSRNWYQFKRVVIDWHLRTGNEGAVTGRMKRSDRCRIGASMVDKFDGELSAIRESKISDATCPEDGKEVGSDAYYLLLNAKTIMETAEKDQILREVITADFAKMKSTPLACKSEKSTELFIGRFMATCRDAKRNDKSTVQ